MALIKWQTDFCVNVQMIDQQHQLLVRMINDLYDAMLANKGKEVLGKLINQLSVYAAMHFAREEHYFEMLGYPETKAHEKEHSDFEKQVIAFENDFKEGRQSLSMDIMKFLSNWLVTHINDSDKKAARFLIARGLR